MATPRILVAYDGSPRAAEGLELGRSLAAIVAGSLELAHVRHTVPVQIGGEASHAGREAFLEGRSGELLSGAGEPDARRHLLAATTTATGLRELAAREQLEVIVFGSAYNTAPGRVHPGSASRRLLQRSPVALAFAPAGFAGEQLRTIGIADDEHDAGVRQTAEALAAHATGEVVDGEQADLIVVGSRAGAPDGTVQVGPAAERTIQRATVPVLVLPRARALFGAQLAAAEV
jgi:nucleotide-binding universal stress UspA family protein